MLNIEDLPFRDNSIDVVLCSEVIEHIYNYSKALAELSRVGRKHLVISFPGHSYIYRAISKMEFMKKLVDRLLTEVGHVSDVRIGDVHRIFKGKYRLQIRIGGALPLLLIKLIPSIKLVEALDRIICSTLEYFGAVDNATIHVIKIAKN